MFEELESRHTDSRYDGAEGSYTGNDKVRSWTRWHFIGDAQSGNTMGYVMYIHIKSCLRLR